MKYHDSNDRLFFAKVPRFPYNLNWAEEDQIIDALNRLFELIFSFAKEKDNVIHFVDEKAKKNRVYYKIIKVFDEPDDFFRYFDIKRKIDKDILLEIIPHKFLFFKISIKKLMTNISNEKKIK